MILTDDEIRKAAEFAAAQMWPEAGYVGWTDEDAEFHRLFLEACIAKLTAGVAVPESKYAATGDITDMNNFTRDQLLQYGASQRLAGREQVLKEATDLDWTAIMCEGCLVTWENAETLGCHAVEHIRALAASPQEQI